MTAIPAEAPGAAQVLEQAKRENFPVASLLFPPEVRPHLTNVYGFARLVDDIGDEAAGDRLALLDWLSGELDAVFDRTAPTHPLMQRIALTVGDFGLPREPFDKLIEANRRDQTVHRYGTFEELREYCSISANPVGELVLRICRAATPERQRLSDDVCTGLQLVEFWQDLGEDAAMDRVYVPEEDIERFGYSVDELLSGRANERFVALMRFEAARTRELLESGRRLGRTLRGRVAFAMRLFPASGMAALGDLERRRFDTFTSSGHASRLRWAWTALLEAAR